MAVRLGTLFLAVFSCGGVSVVCCALVMAAGGTAKVSMVKVVCPSLSLTCIVLSTDEEVMMWMEVNVVK